MWSFLWIGASTSSILFSYCKRDCFLKLDQLAKLYLIVLQTHLLVLLVASVNREKEGKDKSIWHEVPPSYHLANVNQTNGSIVESFHVGISDLSPEHLWVLPKSINMNFVSAQKNFTLKKMRLGAPTHGQILTLNWYTKGMLDLQQVLRTPRTYTTKFEAYIESKCPPMKLFFCWCRIHRKIISVDQNTIEIDVIYRQFNRPNLRRPTVSFVIVLLRW